MRKDFALRIAVDGRTIVRGKSGVGTYVERIMRALLRIDQHSEYFLFLEEPLDTLDAPNLTKVLIAEYQETVRKRFWENFLLPAFLDQHDIDIYFGAAYALPLLPRLEGLIRPLPFPSRWKVPFNARRRVKYIAAIPDVIGFVRPETFTPKMRLWQHIFVSNAVKVADAIITISESTKRDILTLYHFEPSKVHVTPLSVDEIFRPKHPVSDLRSVRDRYSLPKRFILYVGTIEPRKNVAGIARAFANLPSELRRDYPLIIAGSKGWYAERILNEINSLGVSQFIKLIGFVKEEHLPPLISLASLFVFPSLYEGFGYPVLEAMASGVPVITSNTSSLPEVVGDSGIMIDPTDYESLGRQMERVLTDRRLQHDLRSRGLARAREFTWRKTAERTLAVFRDTLA